jgi:predicted DNA-binding transcriptional regulator AlpA
MSDQKDAGGQEPPEKFITIAEAAERIGLSKWWIRDQLEIGAFPRPLRFCRALLFREREVSDWMAAQVAKRDHPSSLRRQVRRVA